IIANYHQLYDIERWFEKDRAIIDLIIIDEAHHQEAATYKVIKSYFSNANIIGLTATPFRSDGKALEGKIIYTYSFKQAINDRIIRNISSTNISQETISLLFSDNENKELSLKEILTMKEESWFNRDIALSSDCCDLIASTALEKLNELKKEFPNDRHQIIAVAMTKRHARELVKTSFEKLGLSVGIVSSDEQDKKNNDQTLEKLKQGRLQVIITIGMLGEGFNHPSLGVAAIFRPYKTLSPFIQFIGRVIRKNGETNKSFVVSHVGLNQVRRFSEFKLFDSNDQKFLEAILENNKTFEAPKENNSTGCKTFLNQIKQKGDLTIVLTEDFSKLIKPENSDSNEQIKLSGQFGIPHDPEVKITTKITQPIRPINRRKAAQKQLFEREKSITKDILLNLDLNYSDKTFTSKYNNFAWIKQRVSKTINDIIGIPKKQRKEITNAQYLQLEQDGSLDTVYKSCFEYFETKLKAKK
ncbi:TPA: DEAD/DEAH box helicase family protein, partial [Legionella pneumophila]|nr:DEAD/DEAH box helicase family protein [Legionella pneumophila]